MSKIRQSEETAHAIVEHFKNSKDVNQLIRDISEQASWYGQHSSIPRTMFTDAVIKELSNVTFTISINGVL